MDGATGRREISKNMAFLSILILKHVNKLLF